MLIISIIFLLLSNAVTLRRDKSILFSRVAILVLLYSFLLSFNSLHLTYLEATVLFALMLAFLTLNVAQYIYFPLNFVSLFSNENIKKFFKFYSLESIFNSSPKPHTFVSLPLQSSSFLLFVLFFFFKYKTFLKYKIWWIFSDLKYKIINLKYKIWWIFSDLKYKIINLKYKIWWIFSDLKYNIIKKYQKYKRNLKCNLAYKIFYLKACFRYLKLNIIFHFRHSNDKRSIFYNLKCGIWYILYGNNISYVIFFIYYKITFFIRYYVFVTDDIKYIIYIYIILNIYLK